MTRARSPAAGVSRMAGFGVGMALLAGGDPDDDPDDDQGQWWRRLGGHRHRPGGRGGGGRADRLRLDRLRTGRGGQGGRGRSPDGVSGVAADASGDLCSRRRLRPGCRAGRADRPGSGRPRVGLDRDDRFDRQLVLRGHRSARRPDGADRRAAPGPVHPVVAILGTNGEIAAPAPAGNELRDSGPAARPAASPISTASGSTERTPTPNGSGSRTATPWSKTPDLTGRHGRQGCQ